MEELTQLKEEIRILRSMVEQQKEQIEVLKKENEWYIEQLKLRAKEKFGASSEKATPGQMTFPDLFNEAETLREMVTPEPPEELIIPEHRRKKKRRGSGFGSLPVEVIEYRIDDDKLICGQCGSRLEVMKKETRRELVVIPAEVKVVEHVTYSYSCRNCDRNGIKGTILEAEHPKALIAKSFVSPSLMADIMHKKYTMSLPLYRQEQDYKRLGIDLSRQNLSAWIIKGAGLLRPLYTGLKESLLGEGLLHADETTLEVLREPGRPAPSKSYMWVYRTSRYCSHPVILYDYTEGRSGDYAKRFLKGWKGNYLHCDGYSGYGKLEDVTLCGCLVHAKRKFHEALSVSPENKTAEKGENYIQKLFAIEKQADKKGISLEERYRLRQDVSKKVMEEFYGWLTEIYPKILPKSLVGKAVTYAINQKEHLCSFLKDARIQLSNNLAEQSVKPFVLGRKNWLFSNTPNGADASAIIYSVIQTAVANDLNPQKYLEYVFDCIKEEQDIIRYLPWSDELPEKVKRLGKD